MANFKFKTICPCGVEIKASGDKPKRHLPSFIKVSCPSCLSNFLLTVKKQITNDYGVNVDILELSDKAQLAVSNKLKEQELENGKT